MARLRIRLLASLFLVARPLLADPPAAEATPPTPPPPPAEAAATAPEEAPPAPGPAPAPPSVPLPPPAPLRLDSAFVHLAADYPEAVLELRSYTDSGDWKVACKVPCDRVLVTLGADARVSAPGMSRSNVFRIDPGPGVALVKVSGGSSTLRTLGIAGLGIGIPLGLAGTAMLGYGRYEDKDGLAVSGAVVLGLGAAMIVAAIPMLISSTTNVRDGKGRLIASSETRSTP